MKIGVMFGNPETTPGGKALKFYSSIRLDCRKIGNIQDGEVIVGSRHRIKVVKNKVASPFRQAELDILNEGGISRTGSLIDLAVEYNIISKSGSFYKYNNEVLGQGKESVRFKLDEENKLSKTIESEVWKHFKAEETPSEKRRSKKAAKRGRPAKT